MDAARRRRRFGRPGRVLFPGRTPLPRADRPRAARQRGPLSGAGRGFRAGQRPAGEPLQHLHLGRVPPLAARARAQGVRRRQEASTPAIYESSAINKAFARPGESASLLEKPAGEYGVGYLIIPRVASCRGIRLRRHRQAHRGPAERPGLVSGLRRRDRSRLRPEHAGAPRGDRPLRPPERPPPRLVAAQRLRPGESARRPRAGARRRRPPFARRSAPTRGTTTPGTTSAASSANSGARTRRLPPSSRRSASSRTTRPPGKTWS